MRFSKMKTKKDESLLKDILRYFSGDRVDFSEHIVDLSKLTTFQRIVLEEVRKIPYGQTITYSELAIIIGKEGAYRAVGTAVSKNPYPIIIPCHRVVSSLGAGGFCGESCGSMVELKKKMLDMESSNMENEV